jgi:hypothetical protein
MDDEMPSRWKQAGFVLALLIAIGAVVGIALGVAYALNPTSEVFRTQEVPTSTRRKYERRGFSPYGGYPKYGMRAL